MSRQRGRGAGGPQESGDRPRLNVLSKDLILSLYLPSFILSLGGGLAAPVLPVYAKSFDVTFEVATLVVIIHGIGGLVATFPTGYLIDRVGRRPVLLAGPILTAITSILTAFAQSFPELLVYRFIGGAAAQMWQQSRLAMIADTGRDRERGRMITWMMEMQRVSHLGSPAIGGLIAEVFGIRVPFIVHGALTLIAIIPSFKLVKETDPGRREGGRGRAAASNEGSWSYVFSEMRKPQMLAFLCAQFLANFSRGISRGGLLNLYAAFTYGVGPGTLGLLATANSVIGLPIGFSTGYIMDRWGRKKTIVPGFSLLFCAMVFMMSTALFQLPFEIFVFSYFAVHLAQGITAGNMQVVGSDLAPTYARGRFMAAWRLIAEAGTELSTPTFAVVGVTLGYAASFAVVSGGSLGVALIVGLVLHETVGRHREREDEEDAAQAAEEDAAQAIAEAAAASSVASGAGASPVEPEPKGR